MPKDQTLEIQNFIKKLGEKLGFLAKIEVKLEKEKVYSPIYDVVWFLNLEENFDLDNIKKYVKSDVVEKMEIFPVVAFEIEGAATSSKNQIGNISNLSFSNIFFKFVIVNNEAAIPEKDSYRRGLKIIRYFNENLGNENIIFLDWSHIKNSYQCLDIKDEDKIITVNQSKDKRKGSGGESNSIEIFNNIINDLKNTKLEIKQDYTPDKCKVRNAVEDYIGKSIDKEINIMELKYFLKMKGYRDPIKKDTYDLKRIMDRYYLPKIDIVLGFNLPDSFLIWIKTLSKQIEFDLINNPIILYLKNYKEKKLFIPLIAIEIEGTVNKHLNGGIINMWKNSYIGILISKKEAKRHLEYFELNGCKNVYFYDYEFGRV